MCLPACAASCLLLLLAATAALSAPAGHAVLIDRQLQRQEVTLQAVGDGRVSYFDAQRQLRVDDVATFVRVEFAAPAEPGAAPAPGAGVLELSDGTKLTGKLTAVADDGQGFTWEHPALGAAAVSLEDVVAVGLTRAPARAQAPPAGTDRLVLVNGDTVDGFLEKLTAVRPAGAGAAVVEAPLASVAAVYVSNPRPRLSEVAGDVLHLRDGGRVAARRVAVSGDAVSFELAGRAGQGARTLPMAAVASIDLGASGLRLVEVGELEWRLSRPAEVLGLQWPVRVAGARVELHAPGELTVALPPGAVRAAAEVVLAGEAQGPDAATPDWAEVEVVVTVSGKPAAKLALAGAQRRGVVNVGVSGAGEWVIAVNEGELGPVLDRVTLEGAAVLVKMTAAP